MPPSDADRVEDPNGLLDQDDHMRDMERLEMEVVRVDRPHTTIARVTGRIAPLRPAPWATPNVAVRIEVESPEGARPISRVYTVRSFDAERLEIEIDFVMHGADSPAMRWLAAATPGARVWMTGPRAHFVPPSDTGRQVAILADDTAIPAVHAILAAWPEGVEGTVWLDTNEPGLVDELPDAPGVVCHIQPQGPDRLLAAAQTLDDPARWIVWAAGERQEMRRIRALLNSRGFTRDDIQILGYWRRGTTSSELDRIRLEQYETLRASNLPLEEFDDADLPI